MMLHSGNINSHHTKENVGSQEFLKGHYSGRQNDTDIGGNKYYALFVERPNHTTLFLSQDMVD